jgi:hypothetical protein
MARSPGAARRGGAIERNPAPIDVGRSGAMRRAARGAAMRTR